MSYRFDDEVLEDRARDLEDQGLNGVDLVFVELDTDTPPRYADLQLEFHNDLHLAAIEAAVNTHGVAPTQIFSITGGARIPGGDGPMEVQVTQILGVASLRLTLRVAPVGDYSTYTLQVAFSNAAGTSLIDPLLSAIPFKFRPGCFNVNCAPEWQKGRPKADTPVIDYLAKDFDSFKHVLINAMRDRVPDWQPTSAVDLDQVILDVLAADADFTSDYQDRVMQERYWALARKRVSLARHARLMDYHIHQGNQASTALVVSVDIANILPAGIPFWTGDDWKAPGAQIFISEQGQYCHPWLNTVRFFSWNNALTSLDAGAVHADLALPDGLNPASQMDADLFRDLLRRSDIQSLVIEERLNPETGRENGRNMDKRQRLRLLGEDGAADTRFDPFSNQYYVRVFWHPDDRLAQRFCLTTRCNGAPVNDVTLLFGNLIEVSHGRPHITTFFPPGSPLAQADHTQIHYLDYAHWQATDWGTLCALPKGPLAYRDTPPGGEVPAMSTIVCNVMGFASPWREQTDLIESEHDDEHFIVETDEMAQSQLRFGVYRDGLTGNGRALADDAVVRVQYQVGRGTAGNIGRDKLTGFDGPVWLTDARNPFDVTNGRDPESHDVILRRVPEAYRNTQRRAVTLADYVRRAEALPEVSHAYASYAWTGSWRTVRVAIDPAASNQLSAQTRARIHAHLDAVRLIGEDLEIRLARYAPLDIHMRLCVDPEYWPEDLAVILAREFSDDFTEDGRKGFFHPDAWTFGQAIHASQVIGRALGVIGVGRVLSLSMRRWDQGFGPSTSTVFINPNALPSEEVDVLAVEPDEVILVANDPSRLEFGRMTFDIQGGRQ